MALKPTIYKAKIALSDVNRNYYDTLNLTIAQHPSETQERMMVRLLAFCINAHEQLVFTKGISSPEEPDLWIRSLDDNLDLWIDVGEPAFERIKKASHIAKQLKVYCFNGKADVWWKQNEAQFSGLNISVFQFAWEEIQTLAALVERTMDLSLTITGDSAYVASGQGECEVNLTVLQQQ
ncbi:MAG: YaeQ family protein [Gammaproteobacteria bacterium]|nr:YaeQ family protein [Gammaproteobacteria bacterium]